MKFQIVKGKSTQQPYFWRIVASNGQTLAGSENYVQKAPAKKAAEPVNATAGGATIEDLTSA